MLSLFIPNQNQDSRDLNTRYLTKKRKLKAGKITQSQYIKDAEKIGEGTHKL